MSPEIVRLIYEATLDTLTMVSVAMVFATTIGLPLGILLATSGPKELLAAPVLNRVLGLIVNATRSTPFIILVIAIIPFTRLIAGTSIGTRAAIVPADRRSGSLHRAGRRSSRSRNSARKFRTRLRRPGVVGRPITRVPNGLPATSSAEPARMLTSTPNFLVTCERNGGSAPAP